MSNDSSAWFVYILTCSDGSYYVGHTINVEERVAMHSSGRGASWTAKRLPVVLRHIEAVPDEHAAIRRELQLKGWSRAKKDALIASNKTALKQLSRCRSVHGR